MGEQYYEVVEPYNGGMLARTKDESW